MNIGSAGAACVVFLAVGFVGGYIARPLVDGETPALAIIKPTLPTDEQATAAVRRHKDFFGSFPNAGVKLGECGPNNMGPGTMCMTAFTKDVTAANAKPMNRPIGFARVNDQWEVSTW